MWVTTVGDNPCSWWAVPTECRDHKARGPEPAQSRNSINESFCYCDCIIFRRKWPEKGIKSRKSKVMLFIRTNRKGESTG